MLWSCNHANIFEHTSSSVGKTSSFSRSVSRNILHFLSFSFFLFETTSIATFFIFLSPTKDKINVNNHISSYPCTNIRLGWQEIRSFCYKVEKYFSRLDYTKFCVLPSLNFLLRSSSGGPLVNWASISSQH